TVNLYNDPETPKRPVTNISWCPDSGNRIVVSYCFLDFGKLPDYSKKLYIWQVDNPNKPYMGLEPSSPCVCCEFNPRDPSVLASGLMTGQVCNWDTRTGNMPVQYSHLQYSHREFANAVKWLPTKSNTEFFSTSSDGSAMLWDTRQLRQPVETITFDFEHPNEPDVDRAIGVSCLNFGPMVGTKFMFGLENGVVVTGSRKARTNAEKLSVRFNAHFGEVKSVDRNVFNPLVFVTIGDWRARVWVEDTREDCLVSTPFLREYPTGGCWNKARFSVFYVMTDCGQLLVWDILQSLRAPVFTLKLCDERLTALAPCEEGAFLTIGNYAGNVFLVEPNEFFQTFERKDRTVLSEYLDRCSKMTKAVDLRLKEIKLAQRIAIEDQNSDLRAKDKSRWLKSKVSKVRESKIDKEREKSTQKERKKIRDDVAHLLEIAEKKYFEAVQQGLEAYAFETDPDVVPVLMPTVRKVERKPKISRVVDDELDEEEEKRVVARPRRSTLIIRKRPRAPMKLSVPRPVELAREDRLLDLDLKADKAKKVRKKKRKALFVLPQPCKREICKPKVCCWRPGVKAERKRRSRGVERSTLGSAVSVQLADKWRRRGMESKALREMRAPPTVFREELLEAKAEIQMAREKAKKSRLRLSVKARVAKRRPERARVTKGEPEATGEQDLRMTEEAKRERKKVRKEKVIRDPCIPPPSSNIVEELCLAMFGTAPSQLSEERDYLGRDYLQEIERAKRRVYPRISEFGHME
ncbi:unnamed protein product, partial [Heterotrigona itama]